MHSSATHFIRFLRKSLRRASVGHRSDQYILKLAFVLPCLTSCISYLCIYVFIHLYCYNRIPQDGQFVKKRDLFFHSSKDWSPVPRCWHLARASCCITLSQNMEGQENTKEPEGKRGLTHFYNEATVTVTFKLRVLTA